MANVGTQVPEKCRNWFEKPVWWTVWRKGRNKTFKIIELFVKKKKKSCFSSIFISICPSSEIVCTYQSKPKCCLWNTSTLKPRVFVFCSWGHFCLNVAWSLFVVLWLVDSRLQQPRCLIYEWSPSSLSIKNPSDPQVFSSSAVFIT